jgi:hypothetical protein
VKYAHPEWVTGCYEQTDVGAFSRLGAAALH